MNAPGNLATDPGPPVGSGLKELAMLFFKLGVIGFGGPAAHIAMMEDEVVRRRQWLTHEHFLDLLGATNLIPGPNSTEMAIHVGYVRARRKGLVVAGLCFILPAVGITLILAYLYETYGTLPQVEPFMFGIRSAIIAVVLGAVYRLGRTAVKNQLMVVLALLVGVLSLFRVDELVLLIAAGAAGMLRDTRGRWGRFSAFLRRRAGHVASGAIVAVMPLAQIAATTGPASGGATITGLGVFFLKIGSILYGSGYVLVAFIQGGLVETRHWLSQTQLLDAIAIGQFTPGPVLSTATFIGYILLGIPGAAVATTGIFLPSFIFVLITAPFVPKLRRSALTRGFLDGVNAASLGLMLAVCTTLSIAVFTGYAAWIIFIAALGVLLIWKINAGWLVVGGAVVSWLLRLLRFA